MIRTNKIVAVLFLLLSLPGCTASEPHEPKSENAARALAFEPLCPDIDYPGAPNADYVDTYFGCDFSNDGTCQQCYQQANWAEQALCNAFSHYELATTFDNRDPASVPTSQERLVHLSSSLHFLKQAVSFASAGYTSNRLTVCSDPSYQKYLTSILTEAASLADAFAMDGADLATGMGDALGSSYSNFAELQRHTWGQLNTDGTVNIAGRRGAALTFLYGLPWKNLDDQLSDVADYWPATLPLCEVNAVDGAVARAIDLLSQTGVPVTVTSDSYVVGSDYLDTTERRVVAWDRSGDPSYGQTCLEALYNSNRDGVPHVSIAEILEKHDVSEVHLEKAARALLERTRVELIDLSLGTLAGCDYLAGFNRLSMDLQRPVYRSRAGWYWAKDVSQNATDLPLQRAGLETIYSDLFSIFECMGGIVGDSYGCDRFPSIESSQPLLDPGISDLARNGYGIVASRVGERYIEYKQLLDEDHPEYSDPHGWRPYWNSLSVSFHNFEQDDLDRIRVFAVDAERDITNGIDNELYDLLGCLKFQRNATDGAQCDLDQWEHRYGFDVCMLGNHPAHWWEWDDNECRLHLPHYRELEEVCYYQRVCGPLGFPCWYQRVCYTPKEYIKPKLLVVTLYDPAAGFDIIDTFLEKRPDDVADFHSQYGWVSGYVYTRHFTDDRHLASKARLITERDPRSCSLPKYNSLGLANDQPVPLENELIAALQPGGTYEDSFAFFLAKAKAAAESAGQAVTEAFSTDPGQAQQHVTNLRQDALDRIEQICGVGADGCSSNKGDYTLDQLDVLPEANPPASCQPLDIDTLIASGDAHDIAVAMEDALRCQADTFFVNLGAIKVQGLPTFVGNALRDGTSSTLSYDQYDGEYKIALLAIDAGIKDLRSAAAQARHELDNLGTDIGVYESEAGALDAEEQALLLDAMASELQAIAELGKCGPGNWGCGFAVAASIVRAVATAFRAQAAGLRKLAQKFGFVGKMNDKAYSIEQAMLLVEKSLNAIQTNIEKLELLELEQVQSVNRAERLAGDYMTEFVGSYADNKMKAYRTVNMRSHLRARRQIKRAKVMAFIARRAVEMKLAVDLNQEKEPGIIGAPPSEWVGDLFTMFVSDDIYRTGSPQTTATDYVTRLEDYVYGYPFQYPFADGEDMAVISLRDDLSNYNEACFDAVGGTNLLPYSDQLDGWQVIDSDGGTVSILPNTAYGPGDFSEPTADTLQVNITGCSDAARCLVLESRSITVGDQTPSGYVGSIYLRGQSATPLRLVLEASYRSLSDHTQTRSPVVLSSTCVPSGAWERCVVSGTSEFAPSTGEYQRLSLRLMPEYAGSGIDDQFELDVWGAQVESCTPGSGPVTCEECVNTGCTPTAYERTPVPTEVCDTTTVIDPYTNLPRVEYFVSPQARSEELRASFRVKCVQDAVALEGQSPAACAAKGGLDYFERPFSITLHGIEAGDILGQGQIGQGNYNYRIDQIAVNLVGSNVKDCSLDPGAGTSCYTNLFIPYDLVQDGKVRLRDHSGNELPFRLAVGTIHQGKAIAAERLLSNPLSSTDQSLVQQYVKHEFRGRPIQGNFTLRIYGTPSLRWGNLEDIQIYLKYRYWSPFSNP